MVNALFGLGGGSDGRDFKDVTGGKGSRGSDVTGGGGGGKACGGGSCAGGGGANINRFRFAKAANSFSKRSLSFFINLNLFLLRSKEPFSNISRAAGWSAQ